MLAIKLFNAQADRHSRYASLVVETMNAQIAVRRIELWTRSRTACCSGWSGWSWSGSARRWCWTGCSSIGMLLAFFAWKETVCARVSALIDKVVELKMLRLQGERLADIVLTAPSRRTR